MVHFSTPRGVVRAVDGVSFSLARGKTLGIVGESGFGQVGDLRRAVSGPAPRLGTPGADDPPGQRSDISHFDAKAYARALWGTELAMVFQDALSALNPVFPVGWQISETLRTREGLSRCHATRRALDLMDVGAHPGASARLHDIPTSSPAACASA